MSNLIGRLVTPFLMLGWAIYYFAQVSQQKAQSQYLIRPVFYIVCVLFVVIVYREIRQFLAQRRNTAADKLEKMQKKESVEVKTVATLLIGSALYLFLLPYGGFLLMTPVFLLAAFRYLKASWKSSVLLAALLTAFVYVSFKVLLGVPLPAGFLKL